MAINSINATSAINTQKDKQTIASNMNTFLTLLTTQLQNQDPSKPMDPNEFMQQLTQLSQVEQTVTMNEKLDTLIGLVESTQLQNAADYIGKEVAAKGDTARLVNGLAEFNYYLDSTVESTNISISDSNGNTIFSTEGDNTQGSHQFLWNGEDGLGNLYPDGDYTITISALNGDGDTTVVDTTITDVVSGVTINNGEINLTLGNIDVPLTNILSVKQPKESS